MASLAATVTAPWRAPRAAAVMCTTSLSSGRPGSCTASAAMPCTWARVGMTTTWMPLASASWAAASATPIESGSLGSTIDLLGRRLLDGREHLAACWGGDRDLPR